MNELYKFDECLEVIEQVVAVNSIRRRGFSMILIPEYHDYIHIIASSVNVSPHPYLHEFYNATNVTSSTLLIDKIREIHNNMDEFKYPVIIDIDANSECMILELTKQKFKFGNLYDNISLHIDQARHNSSYSQNPIAYLDVRSLGFELKTLVPSNAVILGEVNINRVTTASDIRRYIDCYVSSNKYIGFRLTALNHTIALFTTEEDFIRANYAGMPHSKWDSTMIEFKVIELKSKLNKYIDYLRNEITCKSGDSKYQEQNSLDFQYLMDIYNFMDTDVKSFRKLLKRFHNIYENNINIRELLKAKSEADVLKSNLKELKYFSYLAESVIKYYIEYLNDKHNEEYVALQVLLQALTEIGDLIENICNLKIFDVIISDDSILYHEIEKRNKTERKYTLIPKLYPGI